MYTDWKKLWQIYKTIMKAQHKLKTFRNQRQFVTIINEQT